MPRSIPPASNGSSNFLIDFTPLPITCLMNMILHGVPVETSSAQCRGVGSLLADPRADQLWWGPYELPPYSARVCKLLASSMILLSRMVSSHSQSKWTRLSCMVITTSSSIMVLHVSSFLRGSFRQYEGTIRRACWKKGPLIPWSVFLPISSLIPAS